MSVFREAAGTVDTVQNNGAFVSATAERLNEISNSFLPTSTMSRTLTADSTYTPKV